jgi:4-amino-4-deoxy-L-arabinose transferase-like glycosyltransferase
MAPQRYTGRWLSSPAQLVLLVIAAKLAIVTALVAVMDFTIDETYDVVMARNLALAYHDHPPAAIWLIAAAVKLFGAENPLIVRLPTLLLSAAQSWMLYRLTALIFDAWSGLFAVVGLCLSPLFGFYLGALAVTDGPLLFGLTGAALFLARALFGKDTNARRDWLLAGLFFGLALLSKFSAILIVPGVALFLLTVPSNRRVLLTPEPYLAALVALAIFTPVIVWNLQNGLDAFLYQGGRAAIAGDLHLTRALTHTGLLVAVLGPAVWLIQIAALAAALRAGPRQEGRWFFAMLAIVPIAFFLVLDVFGTAGDQGPHWLAPGYLFTFPLLGAAVAEWSARFPRTVRWTIGGLAGGVVALMLGFGAHIVTGWLQKVVPSITPSYDPLIADSTDWRRFRAALNERGLLDPKQFVVVGRYFFCFKAQLVLKDSIPVVCLDDENPIALSLWRDDAALIGREAIIVTTWWRARQSVQDIEGKFERTEPMEPVWIESYGRPVMRIDLVHGENLQGRILKQPVD